MLSKKKFKTYRGIIVSSNNRIKYIKNYKTLSTIGVTGKVEHVGKAYSSVEHMIERALALTDFYLQKGQHGEVKHSGNLCKE